MGRLAAAAFIVALANPASPALAQTASQLVQDSHLTKITKAKSLRVCQFQQAYLISYVNPKTGTVEGVDADMSAALAAALGVKLEIVESSYATLAPDLQTDKCDIGMFGLASTLARAKAVEFSVPYLVSGFYGIARTDGNVKQWSDIDKKGTAVCTRTGSFPDAYMRSALKNGTQTSITPPAAPDQEVGSGHCDVYVTDFPNALKIKDEHDWATVLTPTSFTPKVVYTYAVPQGDQIWLNYINLFISVMKTDGSLKTIATKYGLESIVAP